MIIRTSFFIFRKGLFHRKRMQCQKINLKYRHSQTISLKVDEENNARLRLVNLKTKEKDLRDVVTDLQENLTEEQKSFTHITTQQVTIIIFFSLFSPFFSFFVPLFVICFVICLVLFFLFFYQH